MSSTPPIGRAAERERDALRLLILVDRLGRPTEVAGYRAQIEGESHLQRLDHLSRHPFDLAYVVIDQAARSGRSTTAMRAVRRLVGERNEWAHRRHRFDPGSWHRRDDALALAACRGLLAVRPRAQTGGLRYLLSDAGARWLEQTVYPDALALAPHLEHCTTLRDHLGHLGPGELAPALEALVQRLDELRRDEQVPLEEDLLPRFFLDVFGEPL